MKLRDSFVLGKNYLSGISIGFVNKTINAMTASDASSSQDIRILLIFCFQLVFARYVNHRPA